jgi:hypothetical protein
MKRILNWLAIGIFFGLWILCLKVLVFIIPKYIDHYFKLIKMFPVATLLPFIILIIAISWWVFDAWLVKSNKLSNFSIKFIKYISEFFLLASVYSVGSVISLLYIIDYGNGYFFSRSANNYFVNFFRTNELLNNTHFFKQILATSNMFGKTVLILIALSVFIFFIGLFILLGLFMRWLKRKITSRKGISFVFVVITSLLLLYPTYAYYGKIYLKMRIAARRTELQALADQKAQAKPETPAPPVYEPIDISKFGETTTTISVNKTYRIDDSVNLQLAGGRFLILFPESDEIYSPRITVVGRSAVYDLAIGSCNERYYCNGGDSCISGTTDCSLSINKRPIKTKEVVIEKLKKQSLSIGSAENFFNLDDGHFIYIKGEFFTGWMRNNIIEVVTNFGSYYARQGECQAGQTYGSFQIGPEIMEIYCGNNSYSLNLSYENNITSSTAKIISFEVQPPGYPHLPSKSMQIKTECQYIDIEHYNYPYSYENIADKCKEELNSMQSACGDDNCFMLVALMKGDFSICDQVKNTESRGKCYFRIAVNSKNPDNCEKIDPNYINWGETGVDRCFAEIARDTKTVSVCSRIKNTAYRKGCPKFVR